MTLAAGIVARYGLVLIILAFGSLKFTAHEAEAIRPFVESSPLMRWATRLVEPRPLSAIIGVIELTIAALVALRPASPWLGATGSALAAGLFVTTLSFLFTTPGIWAGTAAGIPLPGPTAAFLLKDVLLLTVALWSLRESLAAAGRPMRRDGPACSGA